MKQSTTKHGQKDVLCPSRPDVCSVVSVHIPVRLGLTFDVMLGMDNRSAIATASLVVSALPVVRVVYYASNEAVCSSHFR